MTGNILDPLASHISFDRLVKRIEAHLYNAGMSRNVAPIIATNCAACERDGTLSHGVFRIPGYEGRFAAAGWMDLPSLSYAR